ncbi:MAG: S8 family serine peptidase [bacterium]|nr:S8 family serine peptidase [bacterium]
MSAQQIEDLILGDPEVQSLARVVLAALPGSDEGPGLNPSEADILGDLVKTGEHSTPCLGQGFSAALWSGYADQETVRLINLHEAHLGSPDCGAAAIVAVIDTGVDPDHPLLADALVPGYDFLSEQDSSASEWTNLDQSVRAIVEQSVRAIVEQSNVAVIEGHGVSLLTSMSMMPLLDSAGVATVEELALPPYFGHGTMVAGIVRLVAPGASIMPLKAFDGDGTAHLFDIVRAIYFAVDHGADVINMSFSMEELSPELLQAVNYAQRRGVVCIAAAGNQGQRIMVYPASLGHAAGVASTTLEDGLADFTNYGAGLVALGAPGAGVISTYPGGLLAAGWGTSFSAPLVSGTVALIHHRYPGRNPPSYHHKVHALRQGSERIHGLGGKIGRGRLDVLGTLLVAGN